MLSFNTSDLANKNISDEEDRAFGVCVGDAWEESRNRNVSDPAKHRETRKTIRVKIRDSLVWEDRGFLPRGHCSESEFGFGIGEWLGVGRRPIPTTSTEERSARRRRPAAWSSCLSSCTFPSFETFLSTSNFHFHSNELFKPFELISFSLFRNRFEKCVGKCQSHCLFVHAFIRLFFGFFSRYEQIGIRCMMCWIVPFIPKQKKRITQLELEWTTPDV